MGVAKGLFRMSAVLWVIWGIVHIGAGVMTIVQPTAEAIVGIADAVDPKLISSVEYHGSVGALLNQHGWNLAWIGLTTLLSAIPIWRGQRWAVYLAALVGGLADLGYFIFMDLGGYVLLPGQLMTVVSGTAIILSFVALKQEGQLHVKTA